MRAWEKHRKALEEALGNELARREEEKPLFEDPLEPPGPHSIPGHEGFGIELPIPADASPDLIRLRQRQRAVLEMMMIGQSMRLIAKRANVGRTTINNWMKTDEAFKAALKAWQERIQTSARGKLLCATEQAADTVIHKLKEGDLRAALAILKMGGIAGPNAALVQEVSAEPPRGARSRAPALEMRLRELLLSMTMPEQAAEKNALPPPAKPLAGPTTPVELAAPAEKVEESQQRDLEQEQ